MNKYEEIRDQLDTGDIVLFSGKGGISDIIQLFSNSKWSHIGMIVKSTELDMVLLWESTGLFNIADIETGKFVKGVQTVALSDRLNKYDGDANVRQYRGKRDSSLYKALADFRAETKNLPYEESNIELAKSLLDLGILSENEEDFSSFFCSELVAEAMQRIGIIDNDLPSNEFIPKDFRDGGRFEHCLYDKNAYGPEIKIK